MTTALAIRDEQHYLATVRDVRALVERIESVGDAKSLADRASAAKVWAERARLGDEQVNLAGVAKLWAERRAGELLIAARENGERRGSGGDYELSSDALPSSLDDLGVTKHESSRYQALAQIPQETFVQAVETAAENGKVSAAAVRRIALARSSMTNGG